MQAEAYEEEARPAASRPVVPSNSLSPAAKPRLRAESKPTPAQPAAQGAPADTEAVAAATTDTATDAPAATESMAPNP
jgi:hypothetical protein